MKLTNTNKRSRYGQQNSVNSCPGSDVEKGYDPILDNMIEGVYILDSNFCYLYVNNSAVNQSKFSKEELIGYKITERFPGADSNRMINALEACLQEQISKTIDIELTHPNASKVWHRLSIQPTAEVVFILSIDITEWKKMKLEKEQLISQIDQLVFKISHHVRQPVCHILGVAQLLEKQLLTSDDFNQFALLTKDSINLLNIYTKELVNFATSMKINAGFADSSYRLDPRNEKVR